MTPIVITAYQWGHIRSAICSKMEITDHQFRNYHEVVGGDSKDLWHEWHEVFNPTCYAIESIDLDSLDYLGSKYLNLKPWSIPFWEAAIEVIKQHNVNFIWYP